MLPPNLAVAGMLRNIRALSATAESCLAERIDGRLKTDLALDERDDRDDRDDHTPCANWKNLVRSSLAA